MTKHQHVLVVVTLTAKEYDQLLQGSFLTAPGTVEGAIRNRLDFPDRPYGHTKHPQLMTEFEYTTRKI